MAAYERRAATTNAAAAVDPDGVERRLFDALFGLGILQPLMDDPRVEEIIGNGPHRIFAIGDGRKEPVPDLYFDDDDELRQLVKRLSAPLGRRLDEASPMVDARLPRWLAPERGDPAGDARAGRRVTIRKFVLRAHSLDAAGRARRADRSRRQTSSTRPSRPASTSWSAADRLGQDDAAECARRLDRRRSTSGS